MEPAQWLEDFRLDEFIPNFGLLVWLATVYVLAASSTYSVPMLATSSTIVFRCSPHHLPRSVPVLATSATT